MKKLSNRLGKKFDKVAARHPAALNVDNDHIAPYRELVGMGLLVQGKAHARTTYFSLTPSGEATARARGNAAQEGNQ